MTDKIFYIDSSFEAKSVAKESKSLKIAGYANTTTKDRAGDVIVAEAWAKGIANYRKNPVLLYQHKHDSPIGKVDKITVDKKGIFVEASISEAAERLLGTQTLIKDGALKSFSVGFRIKDGKYNPKDDSTTITEVELLEISVVSVPCNQDSVFSVRKSFDSADSYSSFVKSFNEAEENTEVKEINMSKEKTEEAIVEEVKTVEVKTEEIVAEEKTEVTVEEINEVSTESNKTAEAEIEEKILVTEEEIETLNDPNELIPFVNKLADAKLGNNDIVNYGSKMYKILEVATDQSPIFKFLEIDAEGKPCDNVHKINKEQILQNTKTQNTISEENNLKDMLHQSSTKENDNMANETVVENKELASEITASDTKQAATVAEPRVAALVEKTGKAIVNSDESDKAKAEIEELTSQLVKHREELKSLQNSKMMFAENSRNTSQFSEKEMANAVLLAKMFNKPDVYDTKYGARMKAVTTVDSFLSNFSTNVYTEMEQQLVIAPMFKRISVDARNFRVPVADEDTDGDVAMFRSGTFATGIADATNVPTSNQNTISSVEFTPHKFMSTTHLAKDEQEDTILPILDFLREGATRRLARAIDKSILRGTGALTGFTASPTNTIVAGTGYSSVIEGLTNLTADASLEVSTGSGTDKADPSDIAAARALMGKYGLQLGNDLVYITSIEGYNNLVTTSDFRTVDKFGPNATYLTGSVGAVYGIPIAISEFLDVVGSTGNHLGILLYKPGFIIAERRGIEIESQYEPRQQVTAMYMSTRFDFHALTTNASAALDTSKYSYATTVIAG